MKRTKSADPGVVNADGHVIGIDIGGTGVRAMILGRKRSDASIFTVNGFGSTPLPPGAVVSGVVQSQDAVTDALRTLWQRERFHCRKVVVGISNPQIVIRDLTLPVMSPEMQAKALPFQARNVIALPVEQALLNFVPLSGPKPDATVDGLLVAAPRQPVLAAVTAVERAGLRVARVDLAAFATLRAITDSASGIESIVDVGADLTTIVIHDNGVPRVVRTIDHGSRKLTDRLADDLGEDLPVAEGLKRTHGLNGQHFEVVRIIQDAIRPLLSEIRSSHHYFMSTNPSSAVERLSLTGGGALLPGLADALADQLRIPTRLVPPMQHLTVDDPEQFGAQHDPSTAVSVGLAIGAAA